jgi:hypothetical protein
MDIRLPSGTKALDPLPFMETVTMPFADTAEEQEILLQKASQLRFIEKVGNRYSFELVN